LVDEPDDGFVEDDGAGEASEDEDPAAFELAVSAVAAAGFSSDELADFRADAPRSFFAQPEPLKWTAGAVTPLRTSSLWQTGQLDGPSAWTPWITSNRCPQ
jgi:hypothetical protein